MTSPPQPDPMRTERMRAKPATSRLIGPVARGDRENRAQEQQLCLCADRTSIATLRANERCLWFSSVA